MLTIDEIKKVVVKVGKKYGVKNAYLFGSYAKGQATEDSDVDILLNSGSINTYDDYYNYHSNLEKDLGTKVDLLTMDGINPRFFELIKNDRIDLYAA